VPSCSSHRSNSRTKTHHGGTGNHVTRIGRLDVRMTIDHFSVSGRACVIVTRRISKPSNQPALDKRSSKFAFRQIPERRPQHAAIGKKRGRYERWHPYRAFWATWMDCQVFLISERNCFGGINVESNKMISSDEFGLEFATLRQMKLSFLRCAGLQAQVDRMTSVRIICVYTKKHNNSEVFL
jgi:hypothetical protein